MANRTKECIDTSYETQHRWWHPKSLFTTLAVCLGNLTLAITPLLSLGADQTIKHQRNTFGEHQFDMETRFLLMSEWSWNQEGEEVAIKASEEHSHDSWAWSCIGRVSMKSKEDVKVDVNSTMIPRGRKLVIADERGRATNSVQGYWNTVVSKRKHNELMLCFSIEMNLNQPRTALETPFNTRASRVKQVIFHHQRRVLPLALVEVLKRDLKLGRVQQLHLIYLTWNSYLETSMILNLRYELSHRIIILHCVSHIILCILITYHIRIYHIDNCIITWIPSCLDYNLEVHIMCTHLSWYWICLYLQWWNYASCWPVFWCFPPRDPTTWQ